MYRDDDTLAERVEDRDEAARREVLRAHLAEGRRLQRAAERAEEAREAEAEHRTDQRVELFARASTYLGAALLLAIFVIRGC